MSKGHVLYYEGRHRRTKRAPLNNERSIMNVVGCRFEEEKYEGKGNPPVFYEAGIVTVRRMPFDTGENNAR